MAAVDPTPALTLPAGFYVDPDQFRVEVEHFFMRKWVCVGRVDDLPARGDFVTRDVGVENLIVVRAEDESIRAFFNVCRHRGTRLCADPSGNTGGSIRCPYHAWTYDLSGRLVGAPHMDAVPGFRQEDWPLARVVVSEWDGHVFINLSGDPAPLSAQLGDLPDRFRSWGMADLRSSERIAYDVAANWKLIIQNYSECLHCPVIHPALNRLSHFLSGENEPAAPGHLGGAMRLRDGIASMTADGTSRRPPLPGLGPEQRRTVQYYAVLPNLLLSLHPDYMMTHLVWPRAVDRTEVVCRWHFHPDALGQPGFDPSDAVSFWDLTNRQDWHVSELSQLGIASRAYRPGPYSARESMLHDFDALILRELGQARPPG
ncbi:aromatic ring-hydroxylating oxygenase subunit alpha [Tautonia plasticadhaerens]|uniref:Biphenyl dioxygenase subunit alpha n=1 Tax=Tautonia plasticadhaerens TaxID=2527974 RepID=A0A518H125_9BACT|nr:aromatic ring-hydroxylating dioxygenase subunit alpha [Tautonia plasticadhaerens]QDV34532.1 Biphenyl dioxygenase subunit alpha [Tautonia plasticadhaerens]